MHAAQITANRGGQMMRARAGGQRELVIGDGIAADGDRLGLGVDPADVLA